MSNSTMFILRHQEDDSILNRSRLLLPPLPAAFRADHILATRALGRPLRVKQP